MKKYDVLFICEANVGRSQMAEGYYNAFTGSKRAISAGVKNVIKKYGGKPAPEIIEIMREDNIDISSQYIKIFSTDMIDKVEHTIVLCEKHICPAQLINSPKTRVIPIQDPYDMSLHKVREIRDEIKELVKFSIKQNLGFNDEEVRNMSCEKRVSLVDGTIEKVNFGKVDLSKLPKPDPMDGAVTKTVQRGSVIDGSVEEVEVVVLPPFFKR